VRHTGYNWSRSRLSYADTQLGKELIFDRNYNVQQVERQSTGWMGSALLIRILIASDIRPSVVGAAVRLPGMSHRGPLRELPRDGTPGGSHRLHWQGRCSQPDQVRDAN